jgi:hypothetical protein
MRRWRVPLLALGLLGCVLVTVVWAFDPGSNEVILWSDANYQGRSVRFSVGEQIANLSVWSSTNSKSFNWNDKVSSIKVGANVRLITWQDKDYTGRCVGFLGSNAGGHTGGQYPRMSDWDYNDKITALKVFSKDDPNANCP